MNAKQKEILQVQRSLLSKNIVWTPALADSLKAQHLLTDSMVSQIAETQGAEKKILAMLDLLPLRTSQVYDKLANALHLSGHTLLADFLREEDLSKQPLNVKDLYKRLPFLGKNMKEPELKLIEAYMVEKIQSAILSHTWQWDTKEKDKALVAKQEQLEQAHVHEQEMKKKQKQVLLAQKQVQEAREQIVALKAELKAVSENSSRIQQQMKGQMDTQMRFSMANDNITNRTNQRLQTAEGTLLCIEDKLKTVVMLSPRDSEKELMKKAENPFCFLPEDVDQFLTQFKALLVVRLKYEDLLEEKSYVLRHMGVPVGITEEEQERTSLRTTFLEYASQNQDKIQWYKDEVARYGNLLDELARSKEAEEKKLASAGTVWQNAIMSVMRKQLQDLKAAIRKKETTVGMKDAEISKLRSKNAELQQSLAAKIQESQHAMRSAASTDMHNGTGAASVDSLEATSASPQPKTNANTLPPLRPSAVKTSASPRPMVRVPQPQVSVPRGTVVLDTPLTMYPAGLTTMQLRVQRDDNGRQPQTSATSDARGKPPMGSTLGDLKAMHAHNKYPASRGAPGSGLELPNAHFNNKQINSPSARRKISIKVK